MLDFHLLGRSAGLSCFLLGRGVGEAGVPVPHSDFCCAAHVSFYYVANGFRGPSADSSKCPGAAAAVPGLLLGCLPEDRRCVCCYTGIDDAYMLITAAVPVRRNWTYRTDSTAAVHATGTTAPRASQPWTRGLDDDLLPFSKITCVSSRPASPKNEWFDARRRGWHALAGLTAPCLGLSRATAGCRATLNSPER